jgi:hypothetical protein
MAIGANDRRKAAIKVEDFIVTLWRVVGRGKWQKRGALLL